MHAELGLRVVAQPVGHEITEGFPRPPTLALVPLDQLGRDNPHAGVGRLPSGGDATAMLFSARENANTEDGE